MIIEYLFSEFGSSDDIVFQIKFLDCVIGRPPSTAYGLYALLRVAPSSLAKNII